MLIGLLAAIPADIYKIIVFSILGCVLVGGLIVYFHNQAHNVLVRLREVEYAYLTGLTVQNFMQGFLGTVDLDLGSQATGIAIYMIRIYFTVYTDTSCVLWNPVALGPCITPLINDKSLATVIRLFPINLATCLYNCPWSMSSFTLIRL